MGIIKVCGIALLCAGCGAVIKKSDGAFAKLICIGGAAVVFGAVISEIAPAVEYINTLSEGTALKGYLPYVFKAVALVYIAELTSDICREAEAAFLGKAVNVFARAEMLIISLPLFKELVDFALSLC